MTQNKPSSVANPLDLAMAVDQAARAIPPAWPLASSVAVNPFLGQTHEDLATVAARLARVAGAPVTMPRSFYQDRIANGDITDADLLDALAAAPRSLRPQSLEALKSAAQVSTPDASALPTVADLAADASGIDWPGLIAERFGAWAAGYLDEGQALWAAPRGRGAYAAWRAVATHDLTPEIAGLSGFATFVSEAPEGAMDALASVVQHLDVPDAAQQTYFHQLLITLGGWAQYARYQLWQAELGGGADTTIADFLAIRLVFEAALFDRYESQIGASWRSIVAMHALLVMPTVDHVIDAILQEASERAAQRKLLQTLSAPGSGTIEGRPILQAAFCIDVRSEVYRRALESINPAGSKSRIAASHRTSANTGCRCS
jgi:uncharacterized protein YbcC (UPF0753/DUF2309 family)